MKIYRCSFHDADEGLIFSWHSSKSEAVEALRSLRSERGGGNGVEEVETLDIPTDRAGLLGWLNRTFTSDNG